MTKKLPFAPEDIPELRRQLLTASPDYTLIKDQGLISMLRKMIHFKNESSEGRIRAEDLVKDEWLTNGGTEPFDEVERKFGEMGPE